MNIGKDSRRATVLGIALVAACCALGLRVGAEQPAPEGPGALVAVGGGGTTDAILARTLELAGGAGAKVVVLAQASQREEAGSESVEMWRKAGASDVRNVLFDDPSEARRAIEAADLVWMPGGSQNRLLDAMAAANLVEVVLARHAAGAVVGGTSAGAAVLSELMLTGEADLERIAVGTTELVPGIGVWRGAIIDQHVLARQRLNRTISAVLDRPKLVGVAVDERTAAILIGTRVEVVGDNNVVLLDARSANVPEGEAGAPSAATGVAMHVLRSGMSYDLSVAEEER